jgi:hypothetical protein
VSWRLDDDCIEVSVSDGGGPTVPVASEPGGSAIGGRGLGIVDRLSVRCWRCTAMTSLTPRCGARIPARARPTPPPGRYPAW